MTLTYMKQETVGTDLPHHKNHSRMSLVLTLGKVFTTKMPAGKTRPKGDCMWKSWPLTKILAMLP